jgi:hypothetical protein
VSFLLISNLNPTLILVDDYNSDGDEFGNFVTIIDS